MTKSARSGEAGAAALALVVSALLITGAGAASVRLTAPKAPPGSGQIVFVSTASGGGLPRVELVDADGSHRRVLADGSAPAWSPDGKRLAYWARAGSMDDLFVLDVASGRRTRLLRTPGWKRRREPAWSPDGHRIAFVARQGVAGAVLTVVRVDTRVAAALAPAFFDNPQYSLPNNRVSWSPDGGRIAFVGPQRQLAVADATTGSVGVLDAADDGDRGCAATAIAPYPCGEVTPAFSPDGRTIAYGLSGTASQWPPTLWLIRSDGTGARAAGFLDSDGPHWSPGGGAIAFAEGWAPCGYNVGCTVDGGPCPEGGCTSSGIFRIGVSGGEPRGWLLARRQLFSYSSVTSMDWSPAWSADGRTIAFAREDDVPSEGLPGEPEGAGLWLVRADGRCPTRIGSGRRTVSGTVAWRPGSGSPPVRHCANLALRERSRVDGLVGGRMVFSYEVSNLGDRAARDILVSLTLPETGSNLALKARWHRLVRWAPSVVAGGRARLCARGAPVLCRVAVLPPGATARVTLRGIVTLQPESAVRRAGTWIDSWTTATLTAAPRDGDPTDNFGYQRGAFWYCTQHGADYSSGSAQLVGTPGVDLLCADDDAELGDYGVTYSGGAGDDVLIGSPGPDVIDPGPGRDVVRAGDDDDVVTAADGEVDVIVCGEGNDRVTADAVDRVDASCEVVERV